MRAIVLLMALTVLAGCQAQSVKPQAEAPVAAQQQAGAESSSDLQSYFMRMVKSNEQVEQRITLMQEQVIKLNQKMDILQQRNLKLMQSFQQLQISTAQKNQLQNNESDQTEPPAANVETLIARLEQQLATGGVQSGNGKTAAAGFRLVSAYTPKQWVIFKYDEATGLTWMAKEGGWLAIEELSRLPISRYEVVLRPAAGDVKGYVAARVDQQTGESWWLKGNQWAPFQ